MKKTRVAVLIVTHDSAEDLPECLAAVVAQEHRPLELVVTDCASTDDSLIVARRADLADVPVRVLELGENRGFAGGMNAALAETDAPFVLSLNADACPDPGFVGHLLDRAQENPRSAAVTGRLIRPAG
ncbi:MAG: glycosyltransferase, partial [Holophagales bacterium]|nr:glycosyltransferase [Holophagales bacterium]